MRSLINHLLLQGIQNLSIINNFVSVFTREERDKLTNLHSEICKFEQQSALGQRFFQDCAQPAFPIIIKQARTHIPHICHFFYTCKIFGEKNLHQKMPIFFVKSVKKCQFFALNL